jgi:hypothetical protein
MLARMFSTAQSSVRDLKVRMASLAPDAPVERQCIIHRGRGLQDEQTLGQLGEGSYCGRSYAGMLILPLHPLPMRGALCHACACMHVPTLHAQVRI